jgi:hypothetical protein
MAARGHHVQLLTFSEKSLDYRCITLESGITDRYSRAPRR